MWEAAGGIEAATRRTIFQDEFKPWIEVILAQVPGGEGQLKGLFHVIVPVDGDNVPVEAPDHTKATHGGALAIVDERAVLGWTSGMFRKKPHSYAIARADIDHALGVAFGDNPAIDVTETAGKVWTIQMFSPLSRELTTSWRDAIVSWMQYQDT